MDIVIAGANFAGLKAFNKLKDNNKNKIILIDTKDFFVVISIYK